MAGLLRSERTRIVLLALSFVLLSALQAGAVTIRRGPLLQNPEDKPSTATLVWWTDVPGDSTVRWGSDPNHLRMIAVGNDGLRHEVPLTGLPVDSDCYYALETNDKVLWHDHFHTPPGPYPAKRIVFVVIGDFGTTSREHLDIIQRFEALKPNFIVTVGDNAYDKGSQSEIDENWLVPWRAILPRYFVYPALGNHDVMSHGGRDYLSTWVLPRNNPQKTERYYSFDYGMIHCIVLDSNQPDNTTQTHWLQQELSSSTSYPWKFVFLHHPLYSCDSHYQNDQELELKAQKAWGPLFEQYGVDAVFAGHHHNYQRSRPLGGVRYIITGGGGEKLDPVSGCDDMEVVKSAYEFVKVSVDPRRALFEGVDPEGKTLDSFEIKKAS